MKKYIPQYLCLSKRHFIIKKSIEIQMQLFDFQCFMKFLLKIIF